MSPSACRTLRPFTVCVLLWCTSTVVAGWTVIPHGSLLLDTSAVAGVNEMSGVTYVGPAPGGKHQFAAIQDDGGLLTYFDVDLDANGSLLTAIATSTSQFTPEFDFEGIVLDPTAADSLLVSEETTPAIRRYSDAGVQTAVANVPVVFNSIRGNRGFESLTHVPGTSQLWTANEEALTIDGPAASIEVGTTVRLLQLDSGTLSSGPQYAYNVDKIHFGSSSSSPARSGLADLIGLPDGTLLALERSLGVQGLLPQFESRIYKIDLEGATDISASQYNAGLMGAVYTPVAKTLLWSGQAAGGLGQNLEGLALGPRLPDGSWALVGVVDGSSSDPLSSNTVVSFQLSLTAGALAGDYNGDGQVNAGDYLLWRNTFGATIPSTADGNGSGVVDIADYTVWRDNLGATVIESLSDTLAVPEPATWSIACCLALVGRCVLRGGVHWRAEVS